MRDSRQQPAVMSHDCLLTFHKPPWLITGSPINGRATHSIIHHVPCKHIKPGSSIYPPGSHFPTKHTTGVVALAMLFWASWAHLNKPHKSIVMLLQLHAQESNLEGLFLIIIGICKILTAATITVETTTTCYKTWALCSDNSLHCLYPAWPLY